MTTRTVTTVTDDDPSTPGRAAPLTREALAAQLPALRRFARAVCSDAAAGDRWVRRTLERLQDGGRAAEAGDRRVALYRELLRTPVEPELPAAQPGGENEQILLERMRTLPERLRRVMLLVSLEGFAVRDVAAILAVEPREAAALYRQAQEALYRQPPCRVLIIEDESVIALDLAETVGELNHEVVGIARTRGEAETLARRTRPSLVLADIKLADDSSGIDAVVDIQRALDVPVVFVTAFPERLLTGERPEPTFIVTKPFDAEMLAVAMAQALTVAAGD